MTAGSRPPGDPRAEDEVLHQNLPRHYVGHLREANATGDEGEVWCFFWLTSGRGDPNRIEAVSAAIDEAVVGDWDAAKRSAQPISRCCSALGANRTTGWM